MSIRTQARTDWDTPARRFPNYASMMFILGFVFIIPDSAYVGNFALLLLEPALIIGLYIAMRKLPNLLSQRAAALLLIATCIWAAPYLRHGGHLLTYIVIAEASLLFNEVFGYVTILISACVIWTISPILNMLTSYRSGEFKIASLYVLFAGILFMVFTSQNTRLQQANEKLEDNVQTIESLTLSRERGRMASEMHDSLGQQLSAVHYAHESALRMLNHVEGRKTADDINADTRQQRTEAHNDVSDPDLDAISNSITRADDITRESLTEVRQMARALSPTTFGQRLDRTTIERMVDSLSDAGLDMTTTITGKVALLSQGEQTLLFRALQETLTNAIRHAHASHVHIGMTVGGNSTRLSVEDDGPGIVEEDVSHGFGLQTLRDRAVRRGGTLIVGESAALGGAKVTLSVPRYGKGD